MNREDIIRMARKADFDLEMWQLSFGCNAVGTHEELERFFQAAYAAGAVAEREACAKACEAYWQIDGTDTALAFAATVRARGQQ